MQKLLIIQTAFIGDVVLATGLLESLHEAYPLAQIDVLVRNGNESLFANHPFVHRVLVWQKKKHKYLNLMKLAFIVRKASYDIVFNLQRYASTGWITCFSGAREKIGFNKNPFSFCYSRTLVHSMDTNKGIHEINRNFQMIAHINGVRLKNPVLYPAASDLEKVLPYQQLPYICIAPSSVWATKQFPKEKWIAFLNALPKELKVYVLGGPGDIPLCDEIIEASSTENAINLAGKLNFLSSAALMKNALMNYVNDSAPMHFCSSVDAPVTAIYCSTVPGFGYGPLSTHSNIVEVKQALDCRPCGLHGKTACPLGHFNCGFQIEIAQLIATLPALTKQ